MRASIRRTALAMTLLPLLLLALALGSYFIGLRLVDARQAIERDAQTGAAYLAEVGRFPVLVGDREALTGLAQAGLGTVRDATAVLYVEPDGRVLAAAGVPVERDLLYACAAEPSQCRASYRRHVAVVAIAAEPSTVAGLPSAAAPPPPIGRVLVAVDLQPLQALEATMVSNGIVISAAAAVLAMVLASLFARRLVRPIDGLSRVVSRIQDGEWHARTQPCGSGELRALEDGVNAMARRVQSAGETLQRRVHEATADLSRTLQDLERQNRELQRARSSAEAASRAKDLFLARMSHELRTPLASVVGFARLLGDEPEESRRRHFHEQIERGAALLTSTIDDILHVVKLQTDSLRLERVEFDLRACLEDVVLMHAPAAHAKGLQLDALVAGTVPERAWGDPVRLAQIVNNLLGNAIKFTPRGAVQLEARYRDGTAGGGCLDLRVTDTGIGIEGSDIEQLFEPFTQADDSTTREFGGSGLGLSICRRLARLMDGDIELRSLAGEGTEARVRLTLERAQPVPAAQSREPSGLNLWLLGLNPICSAAVAEYLRPWRPHLVPADAGAAGQPDLLVATDEDSDWCALSARCNVPVLLLASRPGAPASGQERIAVVERPLRHRELRRAFTALLGSDPDDSHWPVRRPVETYRCRVLVVEDNDLNRDLIASQLRPFGVCTVLAHNAAQALIAVEEQFFDLVLMDVHMPGMAGVDLARALRRTAPELPVYALTANVVGTEEAELAAAGVRGILYKPLDEPGLRRLLARHAERDDSAAVCYAQTPYRPQTDAAFNAACQAELECLLQRLDEAVGALDAARTAELAHDLAGLARIGSARRLAAAATGLELAARRRRHEVLPGLHEQVRRTVRDR